MTNFEEQYILLRQREQRLYSDQEVSRLPDIDSLHPHHNEWQIRKSSCNKLLQYLRKKGRKLNILEIGCGNGWLSAQLATLPSSEVTGIDVNGTELEQAKRVFDRRKNLEFIKGQINAEILLTAKFDIILFAASIQYFPSIAGILNDTLSLLKPLGEIHILDSFFYKVDELDSARKRSIEYYDSLQFGHMSRHYFHHTLNDLRNYRHKFLYNPDLFLNRLTRNKHPFPWICIFQS